MHHILVAPNAFKHSLTATAAAEAICRGFTRSKLRCLCTRFPVADGGDGTAELVLRQLRGRRMPTEAHDPLGRRIQTEFGFVDADRTAVVELANASGLRLLTSEELDPLRATTFGTGELIRSALDAGARRIILAIGGSATVDAGTGILRALGTRFVDATGSELRHLPMDLGRLESIDLAGLDPRVAGCEFEIICDVANPLLGEHGAARAFGPQKGATPDKMISLESCLRQFSAVVLRQTGVDVAVIRHGGAAGGVSAGLHGILKARLLQGIDYFLELTRFRDALEHADLVITGEGRMDAQTLEGKAPMGVAVRARRKGIRVIALSGSIDPAGEAELRRCFDELKPISDPSTPLEDSLREADRNLETAAFDIGNELARGSG